jgi:hypothetical protein
MSAEDRKAEEERLRKEKAEREAPYVKSMKDYIAFITKMEEFEIAASVCIVYRNVNL